MHTFYTWATRISNNAYDFKQDILVVTPLGYYSEFLNTICTKSCRTLRKKKKKIQLWQIIISKETKRYSRVIVKYALRQKDGSGSIALREFSCFLFWYLDIIMYNSSNWKARENKNSALCLKWFSFSCPMAYATMYMAILSHRICLTLNREY